MRAGWLRRRELRVLAAGLLGLALLTAAWGARPADRVAERNAVLLQTVVATLGPGQKACQPDAVPPGAERVRVPATVAAGAARVRAIVKGLPGEWRAARQGELVAPLPAGTREGPAEVCVESQGPGPAGLFGQPVGEPDRLVVIGGAPASGRMRLDYLYGDGPQPLWGATARAMPERIAAANGSAWAPWVAGLGLLLALAGLLALMAGRRELLAVAVMAFGSAATWSGLTPMFQATDEPAHAAYVQAFAELGHPPRDRADKHSLSQEMTCWSATTRELLTRHFYKERPPWRRPAADPCAGQDRRQDSAQYQGVQPPAYYALAMGGYELAAAMDRPLPDRLLLARLVSALLAALTVLFAFLCVREALPGSPWAARAGAIAAGLHPVMTFNHGSINSDALVFTVAAGLAAVLARAWRRGPTLRLALAAGALLGLGAITKITFLLVVPLAAAAQLLIWLRRRELPLRRRAGLLAASWGVALLPPVLYAMRSAAIFESDVQDEASVKPPVGVDKLQMASYVWQSLLPRLPFMEDEFPGSARPPGVNALLKGSSTRLGWWDDYGIGSPFSKLIVAGVVALVVAGIVTAARRRGWRPALAAVLVVSASYTALLVAALYLPGDFQVQGRYMFVLTAFWALAAGACVAGLRSRRRQAVATAVLAVAMLGWSALALEATVSRWYL